MVKWWGNLKLSASSKAGELAAIRGYCKWAVKHGIIEADPTRLIDRPRLPRRVPRPIEEATLAVALTHAPRDILVILCLAAFCGLRAGEISALEWSDVRRDTLLLHGKGDKERIVPLHPLAKAALDNLPGKRRGPVLQRRDYQSGPVPPHRISQWANKYLHDNGITETLHQLRHRYGSLCYQLSNGDIRMVQDLMGHASPVTTAGYAAWDQSKASKVTRLLPDPTV
jgi:integrase/recombinase XerC